MKINEVKYEGCLGLLSEILHDSYKKLRPSVERQRVYESFRWKISQTCLFLILLFDKLQLCFYLWDTNWYPATKMYYFARKMNHVGGVE